MRKKENKIAFVIVRVTTDEKIALYKKAQESGKKFSNYIRKRLGL